MEKRKPNSPSADRAAAAEEGSALFRAAVADVTPLPDRGRIAPRPMRVPRPVRRREAAGAAPDGLSDHLPADLDLDAPGYARDGVSPQTFRRLRRGHWPVAAELDLHGMTRDVARKRLATFLARCQQRHCLCVRIIHGKGHGSSDHQAVLKHLVRSWLTQLASVLAFAPARPEEGGDGAVVVLLRRGAETSNDLEGPHDDS